MIDLLSNTKNRLKNVTKIATASIALAFLISFATIQPAAASAYGCTNGHPTYYPSYCVSLVGSGRFVNYVRGDFRGSAFVCNYTISAEFFRTNWSWYETRQSGTTWGCATGGGISHNFNAYKQPGFMCSTLNFANSNVAGSPRRAMSVCHRIY